MGTSSILKPTKCHFVWGGTGGTTAGVKEIFARSIAWDHNKHTHGFGFHCGIQAGKLYHTNTRLRDSAALILGLSLHLLRFNGPLDPVQQPCLSLP